MENRLIAYYYDARGMFLWSEPFIFERKYADGDEFIQESKGYLVLNSTVSGSKYMVNVEEIE